MDSKTTDSLPTRLRTGLLRLRALFQRTRLERDLDDEVEAHLDLLIQDYAARGMSPEAARAAARRAFGGVEQVKEQYRDRRSLPVIETTLADLAYAVRMLRKSPAFTLVAVISLALGIGANLAVFTVINAILLRTLAVPQPRDLAIVQGQRLAGGGLLSFPMYRDLRARQHVFTDMLASAGETPVRLRIPPAQTPATVDIDPASINAVLIDNVRASFVTASYFPVLGLQPALGRFFTEDEDSLPESAETQGTVAVLSDGFWARQFGRDPNVLGRTVIVNRSPCRIVGVAPRGYSGEALGGTPDLWVPLIAYSSRRSLDNRRGMFTNYMARLAPGVSRQQAEAELTMLYQQLSRDEQATLPPRPDDPPPTPVRELSVQLLPGAAGLDYSLRRVFGAPLLIIMTVVALVLLIACANVANLLLARGAARRREITVRLALGCARARLVRQLLTESLLLSLLGAAAGTAIAWWGSHGLLRVLDAAPMTLTVDLTPDVRVLAFTIAVVLITGIAFGLTPALRASKVDLAQALNDQSRGGTSRRLKQRLSRTLVIAQVALSLLLLIGAGLLVRSLQNLRAVDLGFRPEHVVIFDLATDAPPLGTGPDAVAVREARQKEIARQTYERVRQIPGVQSASLSGMLFFSMSDLSVSFTIPDAPTPPAGAQPLSARFDHVSPGYFETVGMRLVAGRAIEARDTPASPPVAVINETMARRFFPSGQAIGRHVTLGLSNVKDTPDQPIEIVGIVADAKYNNLRREPRPMFWVSLQQFARSLRAVELRTTLPASALAAPVRQALMQTTPDTMIRRVTTLEAQIDTTLAPERIVTGLCAFFGVLALLLASIGLYGVLAYSVSQRTHEIGIRMALGASRGTVLGMVLRQSLIVVIAGIVLGVPLAWLATRALAGFLYGLSPTDPTTIALAMLTLLAVAALAAWLPARRATQVDPMIALRYD
jgi:predicted permease